MNVTIKFETKKEATEYLTTHGFMQGKWSQLSHSTDFWRGNEVVSLVDIDGEIYIEDAAWLYK